MFIFINQVSTVLLSFSSSLATNFLSLIDGPCMVRSSLIDINTIVLKYYPFMISLDKIAGNCNVLFPKICFPKERKDINVKVFNMISNKTEAQAMTKRISCECK